MTTGRKGKLRFPRERKSEFQGPSRNFLQMLVLGIETTCDETAAAVIERASDGSGRILSNIVRSQIEEPSPLCVEKARLRGRAESRSPRDARHFASVLRAGNVDRVAFL